MSNQRQDDWTEMFGQMNEVVADSIEQNLEAQSAFMESWTGSFEDSMPDEDAMEEGIEGYMQAYEIWMDAAEEMFERTSDAAQGEDVEPEEFRDIWLRSANEAFSEVMSTSAFAAANGQLVEQVMEMQQEVDEMTQDSLAQIGMATRDDVDEVGERLVELERRQHAVEDKLDRLIDAVENQ
ncbi:MAG: poly(R)-hydroxyalkanoic acid synthase subunit PhaE [Halovenus sp.]